MKTNSEIAAALRAAKWMNEPIGNKALVLAACQALEKGEPAASGPWRLVPVDATPAMVDAAKKVEEDGYDAMHKAMLAAAPERERLTVWEGTMPESNGKTNYTAILHKGDITKGMTIARSEYPDRVRYEADEVRWLIGERAERPWITDYDADKHSGYVPSEKAIHYDPQAEAKKVEKLQAALRLMTDTSSYLLDGLINATEDFEEGNGISGEEIDETRAAIAAAKELL